jgi:protein SYS1
MLQPFIHLICHFFFSCSCFVINNSAVLLAVIVEKSKKCLDFCVTYFLLHLILSSWYTGHLPRTSDWWIVHLAATLIMVLVGEYLCSRKELSDIPLLEI